MHSMVMRHKKAARRLFFILLVAVLFIAYFARLRQFRDKDLLPLNDFIEYWSAVRIFVEGRNPYSPEDMLEIQQNLGWKDPHPLMMWNPPWSLPFMLPLYYVSYWSGRALWHLLGILIIFYSTNWLWIRYGGSKSKRWLGWLATLFFVPVYFSLYLGQISPLILAGIVGFLWALDQKRSYVAGMYLALVSVKPHVLFIFWFILILWVIRKSEWKIIVGTTIAILTLSLAAFLINPLIFAHFYQSISSHSGPMIWQTPTWGVVLQMIIPGVGNWIRYLPSLFGLFAACILWAKWKANFQWDRYCPTILLLSITASIFTWTFDWVILLPVVIIILISFNEKPSTRWWIPAILGAIFFFAAIQLFAFHQSYFFTIWMPPALWLLYRLGGKSNF